MSSKSLILRSGLPREPPVSVARQGRERRKLEEDDEEEEEVEAEDKDERSSSLLVWRELGFHRREGKERGARLDCGARFAFHFLYQKVRDGQ